MSSVAGAGSVSRNVRPAMPPRLSVTSTRAVKLRIAIVMYFVGLIATARAATLLHHYGFEHDASDVVGGANGTLTNGASVADGTLILDGVDDYVEFKQHLIPTTGSYSFALFAFQRGPQSGFVELLTQGERQNAAVFLGHNAKGTIRVAGNWMETGVPFPKSGEWHHYAVTVDATTGASALFIDGAL